MTGPSHLPPPELLAAHERIARLRRAGHPGAELPRGSGEDRRPPGTFEVQAKDPGGAARVARLWTAHGPVDTPCFMPVGTYGAVKGVDPEELAAVGSQVVLGNAYHLAHRPGADRVAALGGLHRLMGWDGAILTDSGGYQVFSLRGLQRLDDEGVTYRTHFDGSRHRMTPRSVLEVQARLGSDICMVLDHCPPGDADPAAVGAAMARTTRWAEEAARLRGEVLGEGQLCFGIVQGGVDLDLRRAHLEAIAALPFDGLALGGLSVGEPIPQMHATIRAVAPLMPAGRPRYVMGIGQPLDLLVAMDAGVDMFDCVIPSRHARNGQLLTFGGPMNIRNGRFRDDPSPPDGECACSTCRRFSRAYLRHLHEQRDPLYGRLATVHNLFMFHELVALVRASVRAGTWQAVAPDLFSVISAAYTTNGPAGPA